MGIVGIKAANHTLRLCAYSCDIVERNNFRAITFLPCIKHICPLLHHRNTFREVLCMVVCAPHSIWLHMGQLALYPVRPKPQFIEARAPRRARGMRAVLSAPSQRLEGLSQGCQSHGLCPVIPPWKNVLTMPCDAIQAPQESNCLRWQWNYVLFALFHALSRYPPDSSIKIEL